jgi:flagellin FlaB
MIVFIAMVLVAGIAASVLVQTANKLEIQAMETGEQTTAEVATGVRVVDIEGQKAAAWPYKNKNDPPNASWANNTLTNLTITVAPRAGSKDIDLNQAVIEISDSTYKCILTYIGTTTDPNYADAVGTTGVFATVDNDGGGEPLLEQTARSFGIIELEDADNSCSETNPVINRGDKVMLTVNLTACFGGGVSTRSDIWGMVIPEEGAPGSFGFRTPASYSDLVYDLY